MIKLKKFKHLSLEERERYRAPLKNPLVFLFVRENLREGKTPDEIAGRLPIVHPGYSISYETIYRYIYSRRMRRFKYWQYLTLGRKKRMKKNGRSVHRNSKIPGSISIDLRPEIVAEKARVGDWEKGAVENMNGRIRRYIPKGISIDGLTDPRKYLGYLTPYEKMSQVLSLSSA